MKSSSKYRSTRSRSRSYSLTFYLLMSEVTACILLSLTGCFLFKGVAGEIHPPTTSVQPIQDPSQIVKESLSTSKLDPSVSIPPLCHSACPGIINGTKTWELCDSQDELKIEGRCCINTNYTTDDARKNGIVPVLGIDLQNCSITQEKFATGIKNLSILKVVSLEGNPMTNITAKDFNRNSEILYLSLPINLTCPGGSDAWAQEFVNSTGTLCLEELNPCKYHKFTCPENSHCVQAGIVQTECLCDVGFHGYKCLNQGSFPYIPFAVGLTMPTIIIGLLLWLTQRRYVKPKRT